MAISANQVKDLREATGAGILECRKALETNNGDFDKAVAYLRDKGLAAAAKKAGRQAKEGLVEVYSHGQGRVGVMLEVNCETDFVAKTDAFRTLVHNLTLHVAAANPRYLDVADVPADVVENEKTIARNGAIQDGQPEKEFDKIVENHLEKFYQENCLLKQPFVKDEGTSVESLLKQAIATLGENVVVRRFARWERGEAS
jgi:elongation factor Ts